ncbi:MAG: hypothetical protein AMJ77_05030, partial [Dehalococcoidia bacterium SM23_28_2]
RSLLLFDEIGRGTSTYDGMAIARAVVEFIHHRPEVAAKTLFATHYHELTELAAILPRVKNYNVAVSEEEGRVVFLHRILPGGADRSYGVHVAQLAGMPRPVIQRAQEVLSELEDKDDRLPRRRPRRAAVQLSFLGASDPVLEELASRRPAILPWCQRPRPGGAGLPGRRRPYALAGDHQALRAARASAREARVEPANWRRSPHRLTRPP